MGRGIRFTTEFKREAVRLVLSSGRPRTEIAEDLGVGLSSLTRWIGQYRGEEMPPEIRDDLQAELKRLRKENAVLRQERDILKKSRGLLREGGKSMRFALIDAEKAEFPVRTMCRVLDVSESGFFSWKGRPASQRQRDDMIYLAHIRIAFELSNRTYGSPRMHRDLVDEGLSIGRRRTARLMRENGLAARQKRRFKRTTDSTHAWPVAPNLLDQDFAAEAPDQKWSADISYIWTAEGWLYLAVLIDLFTRRVVGWAVSDRLKKDLALRALRMALVTRHPPSGLIHHSDRGSQGGFNWSSQHVQFDWPASTGPELHRGADMATATADNIQIIGGVDTHQDLHTAAVVSHDGTVLGTESFSTTRAGYRAMLRWFRSHGELLRVGVESTGTYGAGITRHLALSGIPVLEVTGPDPASRRAKGKDDALDAISAAEAARTRRRVQVAKDRSGSVEALRVLRTTRKTAIKCRRAALQQLHNTIVAAPEEVRDQVRNLTRMQRLRTCAAWRPDTVGYRDPVVATKLSLKSLARRILDINDEIAELDRFIVPLVEELAPSLLELEGVGTENAGAVMVAVGDNPDRLRSEASFAMMCGVCPIPASSGKTQRHRSTAEATAKPTPPCTWSSCAECEPTSGPEPMSLAGPWRGCPNARSCAA